MGDVKDFTNPKQIYPEQAELGERMHILIQEYAGEMSIATVIGILNMIGLELIRDEIEIMDGE